MAPHRSLSSAGTFLKPLCKRRNRHRALRRQFMAMPFDAVNFV
jgi:hypothetical protein